MSVVVAEAEVFDQVGDRAGGGRLPVPQGTVLALVRQALPDAGTRLVNLKGALPVQVSPSVIFWFGNDKKREKRGFEKGLHAGPLLPHREPVLNRRLETERPLKSHPVWPHFTDEKLRLRGTDVSPKVLSQTQGSPTTPDTVFFPTYCTASRAKSLQSCPTLCHPVDL